MTRRVLTVWCIEDNDGEEGLFFCSGSYTKAEALAIHKKHIGLEVVSCERLRWSSLAYRADAIGAGCFEDRKKVCA